MAKFISHLTGLISRLDGSVAILSSLAPTPNQWSNIRDLASKLTDAASQLQRDIETVRQSKTEETQEQGAITKKETKQYRDSLVDGNLLRPTVFRNNIILIFEGPRASSQDRRDVAANKEITKERCAILQSLSTDGILLWAASYPSTDWAGGKMSWGVFNYLIEDIEPSEPPRYPGAVLRILAKLKDGSPENAGYARVFQGDNDGNIARD
jgi:hypothetical protein